MRSGHSMFSYKDKIVIFGGMHNAMHELNDLVVFNPENNQWSQIIESEKPQPYSLAKSTYSAYSPLKQVRMMKMVPQSTSKMSGDSPLRMYAMNDESVKHSAHNAYGSAQKLRRTPSRENSIERSLQTLRKNNYSTLLIPDN
jgi:hypothetical protein